MPHSSPTDVVLQARRPVTPRSEPDGPWSGSRAVGLDLCICI
jgi:hypothetical protein